jgi:hypothetical protein
MKSTRIDTTRIVFERLFERYGLPDAIQVDNGSPFACIRARAGITRLSAWWVSLGIRFIRSRPAHPQDNGGHERMHLDIRFDLEDDPAADFDLQQAACDAWVEEFNDVRPHEALGMRTPSELYRKSRRRFVGPKRALYPAGFQVRRVAPSGHFRLRGDLLFLGAGAGGYEIGLKQLEEGKYGVWLYEHYLGEILSSARRRIEEVHP